MPWPPKSVIFQLVSVLPSKRSIHPSAPAYRGAVGVATGFALPDGVAEGVRLTPEELEYMIACYYEARGWAADGMIPAEKSESLGMAGLQPVLSAEC